MLDLLLSFGAKVLGLVDKAVPDKDLREKLKAELQNEILSFQQELIKEQSSIIKAEAKSESWLTRTWRPIVMLTFAGLLVADWLGFSAPNLTPELKMKLYDIIQLGLGGYVIGRSGEKIVPSLAKVVASLKGGS